MAANPATDRLPPGHERAASPRGAPAPHWAWSLLAMLGLAAAAYLPAALRAGLLDFDDAFFFGPQNPEFLAGLPAVLDPGRPIANAWLPVAHLSLYFDWICTGTAPFWPHLHALLLHGLAGTLLVRLLLRLAVPGVAAHVAGALFVLHPALAESVAWVSGRKDVLSGLFVFAALLRTTTFAARPSAGGALGLAALAALAMYSKPTAVVLPLLAALVVLHTGGARGRWWAPLVLLAVVAPIAWHHQRIAAAEGTLAGGPIGERLLQVPGAFLHYLTTALWPLRLNVLYPEVDTLARFARAFWPGLVALGALLVAAAAAWRTARFRPAAIGLCAFAVALLPFNTAWPASSIAAADRYLYLAVPGLALALVAGAAALSPRAGVWLAAALLLPLGWLAGARAHDFGDDETLWQHSLAVDADNAVAHLNLVYERMQRGARPEQLEPHLEAAVRAARYPIHALRAHTLRVPLRLHATDYPGAAAAAQAAMQAAAAQLALETSPRRREQAEALLLQARLAAFEPLRLAGEAEAAAAAHAAAAAQAPDHPDVVAFGALRALQDCGAELQALAAAGREPRLAADDARGLAADAALAAAAAQHPRHAGLALAQAEWDRARDRVLAALRHYKRARTADPRCVEAWLGEARLLREREQFEDAARAARQGLEQRPDPALRQELALALVGLGRVDEAELHLQAYLRQRPDDRDTARILANVLAVRAWQRLSAGPSARGEVQRLVEQALANNPEEPRAQLVLGRLARDERRFADAVEHYDRARRRMPGFDDALQGYVDSLAALGYERLLARDDDGAVDAWLRCLAAAPPEFDAAGIRAQLQHAWRRYEARGVEQLQRGERAAAAASFRRCLGIDPGQHWAAWLLATALHDDPAADPGEVERLLRQAVAWQQRHGLDDSRQALLLATTLARTGRAGEARELARACLMAPADDANPQVLAALRRLAAQ